MRVVATGPESSGTRLMSRLLTHSPYLHVCHFSMPYGGGAERRWPTVDDFDGFKPDGLVVMFRDPWVTAWSQIRRDHVTDPVAALGNIQEAYLRLWEWTSPRMVFVVFVRYELLVETPETVMRQVFDRLGVAYPGLAEEVVDENAKYAEPRR